MVGSARTLELARTGHMAGESLPRGGERVWRDYIRDLRERGLVLRAD